MNDSLKEKFKQALIENANSEKDKLDKKSWPKSIFIIPGIVFTIILLATYLIDPYSKLNHPLGKIKQPSFGSTTTNEVTVVGETRNIETGQYIWLAVDKPRLGLCWPKQYISPNTEFMTTILEEGPKGPFTLSMYILNKNFHNQWKEWQEHKIFGGVHMPPESKRLDSVQLILKYIHL